MRRDDAETVALKVLAWIVDADEHRDVFLSVSGLGADDLMRRVGEPELLLAVMDFVLADDRRVVAFCDAAGLRYETLAAVRSALPGGEDVHWT